MDTLPASLWRTTLLTTVLLMAGAAGAWGRCGDQQDARRGGEGGEAAWDAAGICAGVWPQAGDLVHARVAQDDKATARREQQ